MDGLKRLHFYRKTPVDLTEATSTGGVISICALVIMLYLFVSQLVMFWQVSTVTDIVMDNSSGSQSTMGIDFDVTLARLPCQYASVDVFDILGTARINVTEGKHNFHITKTRVVTDEKTMKRIPGAKLKHAHDNKVAPREEKREHHTRHQAIKALKKFPVSEHRDWEKDWDKEIYSFELTGQNFEEKLRKYDFAMVDFFAPWCHWCTELKPVWEHATGLVEKTTMDYGEDPSAGWHGFKNRQEGMFQWEEYNMKHEHSPLTLVDFLNANREKQGMPEVPLHGRKKVIMAKVDCTTPTNRELCMQHRIMGYPTIRIYRSGATHSFEEYQGDRTAESFLEFVHTNVPDIPMTEEDEEEALKSSGHLTRKAREEKAEFHANLDEDSHEGCNVVGTVEVQKVPGKLVFAAHSKYLDFDVKQVNTSHTIQHLSFRSVGTQQAQGSTHHAHGQATEKLLRVRLTRRKWEDKKRLLRNRLINHKHNVLRYLWPLDKKKFVSPEPHQISEHYVKVVHSKMELLSYPEFSVYQMQAHSNAFAEEGTLPTTKISYDVSPLNVQLKETRRSTAEFLTSLCAIIGGVFTVIGLIDSVLFHGGKFVKKMELGKAE